MLEYEHSFEYDSELDSSDELDERVELDTSDELDEGIELDTSDELDGMTQLV